LKILEGPGADEWVQLEAEEVVDLLSNPNVQVSVILLHACIVLWVERPLSLLGHYG